MAISLSFAILVLKKAAMREKFLLLITLNSKDITVAKLTLYWIIILWICNKIFRHINDKTLYS